MYPSETYIDETKVLGIKQVSFEFRSEDCGRQILFFKDGGSAFHAVGPETANHAGRKSWLNVRGMMRSPRAAERMRSQRITVRCKSEHLREVWRGFSAQAAENKQTKFERDSLPDRKPV